MDHTTYFCLFPLNLSSFCSYFCDRPLFDWMDNKIKKLLWNCCSMSNIINPFLYSMYEYGPPIISFNSWRYVVYDLESSNKNGLQADGSCARRLGNKRQRSPGGKIQKGFRSPSSHPYSHLTFSLT